VKRKHRDLLSGISTML